MPNRGNSTTPIVGPNALTPFTPWYVGPLETPPAQYTVSTLRSFYAGCSATDAIGALVYATSGTIEGEDIVVATADASRPNPVLGVIVEKKTATTCRVLRWGPCYGLFSPITKGTRYFVGTHGGIASPPFGSGIVYAQQIGYGLGNGGLFIQPTGTSINLQPGSQSLAFYVGDGPPTGSATYAPQDVYFDEDAGQLYFEPTVGAASTVTAGHGAPGIATDAAPASIYFDQASRTVYVQPADAGQSAVIIGSGPPTDATMANETTYYLDTSAQPPTVYEAS